MNKELNDRVKKEFKIWREKEIKGGSETKDLIGSSEAGSQGLK